MYLLGAHLPDDKLVRIALTSFYGISHATAKRLCARLQIHDRYCVHELNDNQVNQISAYLSSPGSIPARAPSPTSPILVQPGSGSSSKSAFYTPSSTLKTPSQDPSTSKDPLRSMMIESDLKRHIAANINHHRQIGTYIGRRHLQGLPVRGQRTRTNALTAKKLNRGGRGIHTSATSLAISSPPPSSVLSQIPSLGEKFR